MSPRLLVLPSAALALGLALAAPSALARRPPRCPGGRFKVADQPLIVGSAGATGGDEVVVDGNRIAIDSGCPHTKGRVKATRKGTRVTARWRRCHDARRVQLKALITGGCDAMSGEIKVRGEKARKFEAGRVFCADGTEPDAAGNCPSVTSTTTTTTTTTLPASLPTTTTTTTLPMVGGACSLAAVEAVVQAGGTLAFDCDGTITVDDTLTVAAGTSVTLDATGHDVTISGGGMHRVFDVAGSLTLVHLTVSDGLSSGPPGGPPHDGGDGTIGMDGADGTFGTDSQAPTVGAPGDPGTDGGTLTAGPPTDGGAGGDGEGGAIRIAAGGTVTATSCTFESNVALGALGGAGCATPGCLLCNGPQPGLFLTASCGFGADGGDGGKGGAGASLGTGNKEGAAGGHGGDAGRGSDGGAGGDGGGGRGGAVYNAGTLIASDCTFRQNLANGGPGGMGEGGGVGGDGGWGGNGGSTVLSDPTKAGKGGDGARGGDGGDGGDGGGGGDALGGAIYNEGTLSITAGHFEDNSAVGGDGGSGGDGGVAKSGGAWGVGGRVIPLASTFGQNGDGGDGGDGGNGGNVGDGGSAAGGAIYSTSAPTIDGSTTFAGNTVGGGAGGNVGCSGPAGCAGEGGSGGQPGSSHVIGGMPGGTGGNPGSDGAPGAAGAGGSAEAPDLFVE